MGWPNKTLTWVEVRWPRPFEPDAAWALLTHLATIERTSQIVFEARAKHGHVHFLIGAEPVLLERVKKLIYSELSAIGFSNKVKRSHMMAVRSLRLTHPQLALNADRQTAIARSVLAALAQTKHGDDEAVLQVVLGQSFTPSLLPSKLSDPAASWLDVLRGSVAVASAQSKALMRDKVAHHGFAVTVRIGAVTNASANTRHTLPKAVHRVRDIFSALRVAESAGVRLRATSDKPSNLNLAKCPWFYPMRLSVRELLSVLAWPLGEDEFVGVAALHPRILLPPEWYRSESRCFGLASGFAANRLCLGISTRDSLEHTVILGPTGSGKSTAMLNLILADIRAGRSVLVIDPKADLVHDVLSRIPESRMNDVVVLDPTDACPVGFNPLADRSRNPSLVADSVLAVFRDVFADSWGIRTQDILTSALLTLTKTKGASLIWLPALLSDATFRQRVVSRIAADDPLGLGAFWAGFEQLSVGERSQHIAPVMNKVRQFLLRPQLRHVLGQAEPKFSLNDLFSSRSTHKIVLVPLNKGVIGSEAARLLGSLIVGQLWTLALGRASCPPEQRHIVSVFIDEVQDYLHLPTDLADALSQARGLGVGLTLAHQYRAQLPSDLRAGIDANARNKVIFGLNTADAKDMAAMAENERLTAMDFNLLPRFGVYANVQQGGKATGWVSGSTLPAPAATTSAVEVKALSQARYGQATEIVEQEFSELLGHGRTTRNKATTVPIGRKKRSTDEPK